MVRVTPAAIAAAPTTALITSPKKRPEAAPIRKTGVYTPQEIGAPTAMQVKANLHTVNMPRLSSSEGLDQRAVKSKGSEPKSSLVTSCGEERKKPKGKVSIAVAKATTNV
eukprot:scaffold77726_cov51-Phaeocystis_antarctica.AAC.2